MRVLPNYSIPEITDNGENARGETEKNELQQRKEEERTSPNIVWLLSSDTCTVILGTPLRDGLTEEIKEGKIRRLPVEIIMAQGEGR